MKIKREIQSKTNLNGGELERFKIKRKVMEIQSRTNLNGGELERIKGSKCQRI